MENQININKFRNPEFEIEDIFLNRWSPRAMSGEAIGKEELMSLFEAAKWAPSSYNNQPWRFLYALKDTENWDLYFNLLVEGNQAWAKNASALVVIISKKTLDYNDKPSRTHAFDAGAAWQNLALQGSVKGLAIHGMEGFDYDEAKKILNVPDNFNVEAMAAIGKPAGREVLPEKYQSMESPSGRKSLSEIIYEGKFNGE